MIGATTGLVNGRLLIREGQPGAAGWTRPTLRAMFAPRRHSGAANESGVIGIVFYGLCYMTAYCPKLTPEPPFAHSAAAMPSLPPASTAIMQHEEE